MQYKLIDSVIDLSVPVEKWNIDLWDVQGVLAGLPRYLGRTKRTVWEHSVDVSLRVAAQLSSKSYVRVATKRALYHDGSEAFTGDVPGPIKHLLGEGFALFERRVQDRIYELLGADSARIIRDYGSEALADIVRTIKEADIEDFKEEQINGIAPGRTI